MMRDSYALPLFGAFVLAFAPLASAQSITIALRTATSSVDDATVRIADVADLHGGSSWDRRNIGQLDLESLANTPTCSITKKQVELRLMLAGYKRDAFRVTGPTIVSAKLSSPVEMRVELEKQLRGELSRHFAVRPERVSVRLTNPSHLASLEKSHSDGSFTIELMPRNEFPIGRSRLRIDLIAPTGARTPLTIDAQVGLTMKVAIASGPIPRGTVIQPEMFRMVDRSIGENADYLNPEVASGRTTSRYIAANSILLASHLTAARSTSDQQVKRNDLVDVVIKVGRGEIRLKDARAMGSGAIGDTIEVLNPQTNRRINALIIGPNLATVASNSRRFQR